MRSLTKAQVKIKRINYLRSIAIECFKVFCEAGAPTTEWDKALISLRRRLWDKYVEARDEFLSEISGYAISKKNYH